MIERDKIPKEPTSLMDIVDEALDLVEQRIEVIRWDLEYRVGGEKMKDHMRVMKDIRDLLKLSVNFR